MRLEPETTSGPTLTTIAISAAFSSGDPALHAMAIVFAPLRFAYPRAATV